jgi:hypothetical protein
VTAATSPATSPGAYAVELRATAGTLIRSATVTLDVVAAP